MLQVVCIAIAGSGLGCNSLRVKFHIQVALFIKSIFNIDSIEFRSQLHQHFAITSEITFTCTFAFTFTKSQLHPRFVFFTFTKSQLHPRFVFFIITFYHANHSILSGTGSYVPYLLHVLYSLRVLYSLHVLYLLHVLYSLHVLYLLLAIHALLAPGFIVIGSGSGRMYCIAIAGIESNFCITIALIFAFTSTSSQLQQHFALTFNITLTFTGNQLHQHVVITFFVVTFTFNSCYTRRQVRVVCIAIAVVESNFCLAGSQFSWVVFGFCHVVTFHPVLGARPIAVMNFGLDIAVEIHPVLGAVLAADIGYFFAFNLTNKLFFQVIQQINLSLLVLMPVYTLVFFR